MDLTLYFSRYTKNIPIYYLILKVSVHPVNTPFPGGFKVKFVDNKYLCPVKERQKKQSWNSLRILYS
jgi:uncharacterized protein (UPF0305 family)